jgi:hypothetical protein
MRGNTVPNATSNTSTTEKKELESLPEGFVIARHLTYGEKIQRRAMTSNMTMKGDSKSKDFDVMMNLANEQATLFDFQHCIVEHNLTDENDRPLNLGNIADIRKLDGKIGEEIEAFLDELNNFEGDEGNSEPA